MDLKSKPSSNIVDLTSVSGPGYQRQRYLDNFLNALVYNRKSLPNKNYESGLGKLPRGKLFPFRPVEGPEGNMLVNILTNSDIAKDRRQSEPFENSRYYEDFLSILRQEPEMRGSVSEKLKKRYK